MRFEAFVVALAGIGCGTGLIAWFMVCVRDIILRRGPRIPDMAVTEMRALRDEIQALRKENHDLVLGFDSTLQQLDRRLERVEGQRTVTGEYGASRERDAELRVGAGPVR